LQNAITEALSNNVDISIERRNLHIAEFEIKAAEGVYEPVFSATPTFSSLTQPNIGRFSGVSSAESATSTNTLSLDGGLEKKLRFGGGDFQTSFTNQRTTSNSAIVSPLYQPDLSFSFTQPLWRNRSIDSNRLQIYVARKTFSLTDSQFRQQVISTVYQVQQAYWNLAFALRNVSVQQDGVDLAQKQVDDNQKQLKIGMLAPLDVVSAQTTLETRKQALAQGQIAALQAQNTLKNLVAGGTDAVVWGRDINPIDFFEEQPLSISLDDALTQAYTNRPEAEQFKIQKDINKLDVDFFRNQTRPEIDVVGSYGISGAGGTPVSSPTCPTGTSLSGTLCQPGGITPTSVPANINNNFVGGYGTALGNMFSNKYHDVSVGLTISLPLHNKTAKANLGKALETESQTELQERKQLQSIEVDVRNAYQSIALAQKNLDAARLARQYAETQLDGEQKKFAAGLSTTFLVLTRQNDLIQARGDEINALSAYNKAVSALQLATGATLVTNNVEIR